MTLYSADLFKSNRGQLDETGSLKQFNSPAPDLNITKTLAKETSSVRDLEMTTDSISSPITPLSAAGEGGHYWDRVDLLDVYQSTEDDADDDDNYNSRDDPRNDEDYRGVVGKVGKGQLEQQSLAPQQQPQQQRQPPRPKLNFIATPTKLSALSPSTTHSPLSPKTLAQRLWKTLDQPLQQTDAWRAHTSPLSPAPQQKSRSATEKDDDQYFTFPNRYTEAAKSKSDAKSSSAERDNKRDDASPSSVGSDLDKKFGRPKKTKPKVPPNLICIRTNQDLKQAMVISPRKSSLGYQGKRRPSEQEHLKPLPKWAQRTI
ncbi:hypothetical protein HK102_005691 [Quaeritorhiza haematococci]|nr:hypothetical protein HK102_005691 [Quaeritorhiza haematococci]